MSTFGFCAAGPEPGNGQDADDSGQRTKTKTRMLIHPGLNTFEGMAMNLLLGPACDPAGYAFAPAAVIALFAGMNIVINVYGVSSLKKDLEVLIRSSVAGTLFSIAGVCVFLC